MNRKNVFINYHVNTGYVLMYSDNPPALLLPTVLVNIIVVVLIHFLFITTGSKRKAFLQWICEV